MARGQEEKNEIIKKILEIFPNSFEYEKAIRIPVNDVQIKVQLTCAKDNVEIGEDQQTSAEVSPEALQSEVNKTLIEPSAEEIENVRNLIKKLDL